MVESREDHCVVEIRKWREFCDRYMNERHLARRNGERKIKDRNKKTDNNIVMSALNTLKDLEEIKEARTYDATVKHTEVKSRRFKIKSEAFLKLYQVCLKT